jgi:hypothetical protein
MYTVATFQLAKSTGLDFLFVIPRVFVFAALAAWVAAFVGFVLSFFSPGRVNAV